MTTTLIERFWMHVFNRPSSKFMLAKSADNSKILSISWMRAGIAVAILMDHLRNNGFKKGDRAAILGWNSPEWVFADLAIQSLGGVTVPIYPNSAADQVNYILSDAGVSITFSDDSKQLEKVKVGAACNFATIAKLGDCVHKLPERDSMALPLPSMAVAKELGDMRKQFEAGEVGGVTHDDLATLIYTSGSSGTPKGCKISHGNIAASIGSVTELINLNGATDVYLSYLPLAHVYERINGMGLCIWSGVPVAFSPVDKVAENLVFFKPTLLCGVPAVWEKMRNGIYDPKKGFLPTTLKRLGLWKPLLDAALSCKKGSVMQRLLDKKLFSPIRAALGGRLKLLVSGGAPIAPETLHFYNGLGLQLLEGYGATETTSAAVSNRPQDPESSKPTNKVGSVGLPVSGLELRIVADPAEELGLGEIQMRGAQIFGGYWNLPEATAEAFTADGWFRTGDLGRLDDDGFLYVAGRANGMYKTTGGKFVCREKLEGALKAYPIVQYSVPVAHGRKFATVLIFVNPDVAAQLTGKKAPAGVDAAAFYATQPEVLKAVDEAVAGANKELEHWEKMQYSRIIPVAATVDNGIVTETLKIRSKVLLKRFEKEIDELYAAAESRKS